MGLSEALSLFIVMIALAAIPSLSVALVISRSISHGFTNGIAVSIGIVLGDLVFILLALLGLAYIAETVGWLFIVIKYLGATYLIFLGYSLLKAQHKPKINTTEQKGTHSLITSLLSGFFLTLGDIKALFFYVSLLPTFVDLHALKSIDLLAIMLITILSVGGVKVFYAFSATRIMSLSKNLNVENKTRKTAAVLMLCSGGYLFLKT